jgi:hypothetical protein
VRDILRRRKAEKKPRDYVRFLYGNRMAAALNLPELFHSSEIYKLHPEPDIGAAIMVVHRFAPQIASELFNYSKWAAKPAPMDTSDPSTCPCHGQVLSGTPLHEGHVLATDPALLKSAYLQDILSKGKKYRLQQPLPSVLLRLQDGLEEYTAYKVKSKQGDQAYATALARWAAAIMAAARTRLSEAAVNQAPEPDGYPGLKDQLQAAQNALVFGPEDRAPHALFFCCGRLYASKLLQRLEESGAFVQENRPPAEILQTINEFNDEVKVEHHPRLPYLYGAWKAKKQAFRWIAGTSRVQDAPEECQGKPKEEGAPKNALTNAASMLVPIFQHIFKALRRKDLEGRAQGRPARYWVIEDIDEFVQDFRANAAPLAQVPWATYDFTTMYEALEHSTLLEGCMAAAQEAWDYEESCAARQAGKRPEEVELALSTSGWAELILEMQEDTKLILEMQEDTKFWFTPPQLRDVLTFMLDNLYINNGGIVRKQVKGVPMGLNCAGQMANAYGYSVESQWVDACQPNNIMSRRYIDDIFVAGQKALQPGQGLPSEDDYKMQYKLTSESASSLIYIGVRLFVDDKGEAHTVLHDRRWTTPSRLTATRSPRPWPTQRSWAASSWDGSWRRSGRAAAWTCSRMRWQASPLMKLRRGRRRRRRCKSPRRRCMSPAAAACRAST